MQIHVNDLMANTFESVMRDILSENHAEYWFKGGRSSTKSSFISLMIVLGLLIDKKANAIIYRRVGNTIRDSVYAQITWAIDALGVSAAFKFRNSPMEITIKKTGQRIMFRGADDPVKSKSIKLSYGYFRYLWFEELTEFRSPDDIRSIKQSIFRGVEKAQTFYSYNPPKTANTWVNLAALEDDPRRLVHHSTYLDVPREWLGSEFIAMAESVKATNERAYKNEYLGEVTGTGGTVFDNLEVREITDDEINTLDRFYNGLDFGFAVDPDAFTRWAYDRRARKLYAIAEFYAPHVNIDVLSDKVQSQVSREIVRCDSADPRMIAELQRRSLNAIGVKKGAGSRDHGFRWLQDQASIIIDPKRTPNIAREFQSYEYPRDKNGNFIPTYPDGDDHTIDSCRYALEPEIGRRIAVMRNDIY